jgi:hypothetical protein
MTDLYPLLTAAQVIPGPHEETTDFGGWAVIVFARPFPAPGRTAV